MHDSEKVKKGLEHCRKYGTLGGQDCNGHYERYTEDGCAIKLVDEHRSQCPYGKCKTGCVVTLVDDALALLKEKKAKQIVRKQCKKERDDGAIDYFAEWYCPHCNMLILRGFDNPSIKFCYKCGKPILWKRR